MLAVFTDGEPSDVTPVMIKYPRNSKNLLKKMGKLQLKHLDQQLNSAKRANETLMPSWKPPKLIRKISAKS